MKNTIRKILKEELGDDFDWIREIPSFELGNLFVDAEVCENSSDDCGVNVNLKDSEIIFVLDYEKWKNHVELDDDGVISTLFKHGGRPFNYSYNLRGEMDSDEVNYMYYYLSDEQKDRFNEILTITTNGSFDLSYLEDDNFSDIADLLLHPELKKKWDYFVWDYLAPLERALEENTWSFLHRYYKELLEKNNIEIDLDYSYYSRNEAIKITVPIKFLTDNNLVNLTQVVDVISEPFVSEDWYELAYGDYDTSGAEDEVNQVINNFLDEVEEFLEEEGVMDSHKKFLEMLGKLNFDSFEETWVEGLGRRTLYTKKLGDDFYVGVTPKIDDDGDNAYVIIQDTEFKKYGTNNILYKNIVPIDEVGQYIYNYKLDFDQKND